MRDVKLQMSKNKPFPFDGNPKKLTILYWTSMELLDNGYMY